MSVPELQGKDKRKNLKLFGEQRSCFWGECKDIYMTNIPGTQDWKQCLRNTMHAPEQRTYGSLNVWKQVFLKAGVFEKQVFLKAEVFLKSRGVFCLDVAIQTQKS